MSLVEQSIVRWWTMLLDLPTVSTLHGLVLVNSTSVRPLYMLCNGLTFASIIRIAQDTCPRSSSSSQHKSPNTD